MNLKLETGSPYFMKYINKKIILHHIRMRGTVSRAEIADQLQLSKPTVSSIVDELLAEDWIKEMGSGDSTTQGGRKPIQLQFNAKAGFIIGVDIGGTKIAYGIGDLDGNVVIQEVMPTQPFVPDGIVDELADRIRMLLHQINIPEEKVLGMGVGSPGITNVEKGITTAPSLSWSDYPLKEKLEEKFPFPVYVDNDVNISVLGEQWLGSAVNKKNVVLITIGTGIGCGIILNGTLYRGANWAAGEIGYMVTDKNAAKKDYNPVFDGFGFLENHAGGASIEKIMKNRLKESSDHPLSQVPFTTKDVFTYARENDPLALEVVNEVIEHIGFALVNVAALFNPEIIIIGGGVSRSGIWFIERLNDILKTYLPTDVQLSLTKLGDQIGIVGGMSLFLREHESLLKI